MVDVRGPAGLARQLRAALRAPLRGEPFAQLPSPQAWFAPAVLASGRSAAGAASRSRATGVTPPRYAPLESMKNYSEPW